jgi:hypothetical protein
LAKTDVGRHLLFRLASIVTGLPIGTTIRLIRLLGRITFGTSSRFGWIVVGARNAGTLGRTRDPNRVAVAILLQAAVEMRRTQWF